MPKAQAKKEAPVSKPLAENKARVKHIETGKVIEVDALHALTVLGKQFFLEKKGI
jgi:hypothetical protein